MKRIEIANKALKLIGINSRYSTATPDELDDALDYLDDYIMSLNGQGYRLGYVLDSDPNAESGIPDWAIYGVVNNLALYLCSFYEKSPAPSLVQSARDGMETIVARTSFVKPIQKPRGMPRGTGNSSPYSNKYFGQVDTVQTAGDLLLDDGEDLITDETTSC